MLWKCNCCGGGCCQPACIAPCCSVTFFADRAECAGGGTLEIPLSFDGCIAPVTLPSVSGCEGCDQSVCQPQMRVRALCERKRCDCGTNCAYQVEVLSGDSGWLLVQFSGYTEVAGALPVEYGYASPVPAYASFRVRGPCNRDQDSVGFSEPNHSCRPASECSAPVQWDGSPFSTVDPVFPVANPVANPPCSDDSCYKCECPTGWIVEARRYHWNNYPQVEPETDPSFQWHSVLGEPPPWSSPDVNVPVTFTATPECYSGPTTVLFEIFHLATWPLQGPTCDANGLTFSLKLRFPLSLFPDGQACGNTLEYVATFNAPGPLNYGNTRLPLTLTGITQVEGPAGFEVDASAVEIAIRCPGCCCKDGSLQAIDSYTDCLGACGRWTGKKVSVPVPGGNSSSGGGCEPCQCCGSGFVCVQTVIDRVQWRPGDGVSCNGGVVSGGTLDPDSQPAGTIALNPNTIPCETGLGGAGCYPWFPCIQSQAVGLTNYTSGFSAPCDGSEQQPCDPSEVQASYTRVRVVKHCSDCVDSGPIDENAICQQPGVYNSACYTWDAPFPGWGSARDMFLCSPGGSGLGIWNDCSQNLSLACGSEYTEENPFP